MFQRGIIRITCCRDVAIDLIASHHSCPDHLDILKEFPEPKNLLYTTLSRSLGLSDLSQFIQYHCTDNGDVKVSEPARVIGHNNNNKTQLTSSMWPLLCVIHAVERYFSDSMHVYFTLLYRKPLSHSFGQAKLRWRALPQGKLMLKDSQQLLPVTS